MRILKTLLLAAVVFAALGFALIYSGLFNVAADEPHWGITHRILETVRGRSIAAAARSVPTPPALDDPPLIAAGAQEYAEMCTGCHLAPGMRDTELRAGLYPKPPNLAEHAPHGKPAETFWVIKHGLKMTGMPAWGLTHDDQRLWSMVAFLQQLPRLTPEQYQNLAARGENEADEHGHDHSAGDSEDLPKKESASDDHSHSHSEKERLHHHKE